MAHWLIDAARAVMPSLGLFGSRENTVAQVVTPTYQDVRAARATLKSLGLPTEIILQILNHARYWPGLAFESGRSHEAACEGYSVRACACLQAGILDDNILKALDTGEDKPKVKEIVFDVTSMDQGWTSERTTGTFNTSSWTEVSILREFPNSSVVASAEELLNEVRNADTPGDLLKEWNDRGWTLATRPAHAERGSQDGEGPYSWYLQGNLVAMRTWNTYRVIWAEDRCEGNSGAGKGEGFLKELNPGDRIVLWARAKYPGWCCYVKHARITVRYGF